MLKFTKSVLSNDNGVGSTNRVCLLAVIAFLLGWSTHILVTKSTIPDVPSTWIDIIMWLGGFTAVGKVAEVVKVVGAKTGEPQSIQN